MSEPREVKRVVADERDFGWPCAAYSLFGNDGPVKCMGMECATCFMHTDREVAPDDEVVLLDDNTVKLIKAGQEEKK